MTDYNKWERINASIEDDETDIAREKLRMQKEQMSEKEVRRIHECWEKPEFRAMFDEYAQEVSQALSPARSLARRGCLSIQTGSVPAGVGPEAQGRDGGVPGAVRG